MSTTDFALNGAEASVPAVLFRSAEPEEIVRQASAVARALAPVIEDRRLYTEINGRRHVRVEGWTLLGSMLGVFPVCVWSRELPDGQGWEARVEARTLGGALVGAAEASCMRDEPNWRDKPDYALRSMAQCVPLHAEILTRSGFRSYNEIAVGEEVLAYDCESDICRWTPLRAISVYPQQPLMQIRSRSLNVAMTANHTWAVRRLRTGRRLPFQELISAQQFSEYSRTMSSALVIAAPAESGSSPLTPEEAALVGWLITDGTNRQPPRGYLRAHIDQSKPRYVDEIRKLVGISASEFVTQQPPRTFPTGRTYATQPSHRFGIPSRTLRSLFEKAGIRGRADCPALATRLSAAARGAMLDAMLKAEGHQLARGNRTGRTWRCGQKNPFVLETFQILASLEGRALGRPAIDPDGFTRQMLRANRHIQLRALRSSSGGCADVWCPTTDFGTWVMRLDGQVMITGNTRATSKALRLPLGFVVALAGYEATPAEEADGARSRVARAGAVQPPPSIPGRGSARSAEEIPPATEPQIRAIYAIGCGGLGMEDSEVDAVAIRRFGAAPAGLNRRQASELIDALKSRPRE